MYLKCGKACNLLIKSCDVAIVIVSYVPTQQSTAAKVNVQYRRVPTGKCFLNLQFFTGGRAVADDIHLFRSRNQGWEFGQTLVR
jgi:hypothetical protein